MYNVFDYRVYNVFGRIPCVRYEVDTALAQALVFGFKTVFFFFILVGFDVLLYLQLLSTLMEWRQTSIPGKTVKKTQCQVSYGGSKRKGF